jgi:tripartite-type tricarboxylate transporter receptor subunit TctC
MPVRATPIMSVAAALVIGTVRATMRRHFAAVLCAALSFGAAPSHAQDVAGFYRGKTLSIIVGSPPGGGYDTYARMIGRSIGRHIPGRPAVVVQNMSGASGYIAASHIYNVAPKDGLTMATVTPGALMLPLLGDLVPVRIDANRFNFIGSATRDVYVCLVRRDAAVKKYSDLFSRELVVGSVSEGGSVRDFPLLQNRVLGTKFKIVNGYPGNRAVTLAVEKGEVQGACGNSWAGIFAMRPTWFTPDGVARVLVQEDLKGHPDLNKLGIPRTIDFAKTDEQRQVMSLLYRELLFSRPYFVGPGVPSERVAALREAFSETLTDPDFLADVKRLKVEIDDPLSGQDLQKLIANMYATPPDVVAKLRAALKE